MNDYVYAVWAVLVRTHTGPPQTSRAAARVSEGSSDTIQARLPAAIKVGVRNT